MRSKIEEGFLLAKFFSNINKQENGCWLWTASNTGTYAQIWNGLKLISVHVFSYEVFIGPISPGLNVCHTCDNKLCANPMHLFLGTYTDNMQDAKTKSHTSSGEKNGNHKLTEETVRAIRNDTRSSRLCQDAYGVSQTTVVRIRSRQIWAHLK
jgi:HNH endonuclease